MFLQEHSAGSWDYLDFSSTVSFSVVFLQEHSAALCDSRHVLNVHAGTLAAWSARTSKSDECSCRNTWDLFCTQIHHDAQQFSIALDIAAHYDADDSGFS